MEKKLDQEHVDAIMELRSKMNQNTATMGLIAIDEQLLTQQLTKLEEAKSEQMDLFGQLRTQETELVATLKERYGEGEINLETGTFTSAE